MTGLDALRRIPLLFSLMVLCWSENAQSQTEPEWAKRFDGLIERGMKEHHIPGLAIGVIVDGRLVTQGPIEQMRAGAAGGATLEELFITLVGGDRRETVALDWI